MKHRDLNAPPAQQMADIVRALKERAESSKTTAHGVKDMGAAGDVVWPRPDGSSTSVRDLDEGLTAAQSRIAEAEGSLADSQSRLEGAEGQLLEAQEALDALDSRLDVTALQVSRGPLPPAGAPLGAQWLTPEGYLYVRVPCDEEAA